MADTPHIRALEEEEDIAIVGVCLPPPKYNKLMKKFTNSTNLSNNEKVSKQISLSSATFSPKQTQIYTEEIVKQPFLNLSFPSNLEGPKTTPSISTTIPHPELKTHRPQTAPSTIEEFNANPYDAQFEFPQTHYPNTFSTKTFEELNKIPTFSTTAESQMLQIKLTSHDLSNKDSENLTLSSSQLAETSNQNLSCKTNSKQFYQNKMSALPYLNFEQTSNTSNNIFFHTSSHASTSTFSSTTSSPSMMNIINNSSERSINFSKRNNASPTLLGTSNEATNTFSLHLSNFDYKFSSEINKSSNPSTMFNSLSSAPNHASDLMFPNVSSNFSSLNATKTISPDVANNFSSTVSERAFPDDIFKSCSSNSFTTLNNSNIDTHSSKFSYTDHKSTYHYLETNHKKITIPKSKQNALYVSRAGYPPDNFVVMPLPAPIKMPPLLSTENTCIESSSTNSTLLHILSNPSLMSLNSELNIPFEPCLGSEASNFPSHTSNTSSTTSFDHNFQKKLNLPFDSQIKTGLETDVLRQLEGNNRPPIEGLNSLLISVSKSSSLEVMNGLYRGEDKNFHECKVENDGKIDGGVVRDLIEIKNRNNACNSLLKNDKDVLGGGEKVNFKHLGVQFDEKELCGRLQSGEVRSEESRLFLIGRGGEGKLGNKRKLIRDEDNFEGEKGCYKEEYSVHTEKRGVDTEKCGVNTEKYGVVTEEFGVDTEEFGVDTEEFDVDREELLFEEKGIEEKECLGVHLLNELKKLESMYKSKGDKWRSYSFGKAVRTVSKVYKEITIENYKEVCSCEGIGTSILKTIGEILEGGEGCVSTRKMLLEKEEGMHTLEELQRVWGIGHKTALKLYKKGVHTLEQLKHKQHIYLSHTQQITLQFLTQLEQKIPYAETQRITQHIIQTLLQTSNKHNFYQTYIHTHHTCGSFRRHKTHSGDIDLLLITRHNNFDTNILKMAVDILHTQGILTHHLTLNKHTKYVNNTFETPSINTQDSDSDTHRRNYTSPLSYNGICVDTSLGVNAIHRRIDIKVYPPLCEAFALLYFTGSAEFGRSLRLLAKNKSLHLNDRGLYECTYTSQTHIKRRRIHCNTEEEIFNALGVKYRTPQERESF